MALIFNFYEASVETDRYIIDLFMILISLVCFEVGIITALEGIVYCVLGFIIGGFFFYDAWDKKEEK